MEWQMATMQSAAVQADADISFVIEAAASEEEADTPVSSAVAQVRHPPTFHAVHAVHAVLDLAQCPLVSSLLKRSA